MALRFNSQEANHFRSSWGLKRIKARGHYEKPKVPTSNKLTKMAGKPGQLVNKHTHTHPHRARAGDKEREREKQSWRGTRTNRDADTKKTRRQFGPKEGQEGAYIISKENEKENVNMTGDE